MDNKEETCPVCGEGYLSPEVEAIQYEYCGVPIQDNSYYHICVGGCGIVTATDRDLMINAASKVKHRSAVEKELFFTYEKLLFNLQEDILILMEHKGVSKTALAKNMRLPVQYIKDILSGDSEEMLDLRTLNAICFTLGAELTIKVADESITHLPKEE